MVGRFIGVFVGFVVVASEGIRPYSSSQSTLHVTWYICINENEAVDAMQLDGWCLIDTVLEYS